MAAPNTVIVAGAEDLRLSAIDRDTNQVVFEADYTSKKARTTAANALKKVTGWPVVDHA